MTPRAVVSQSAETGRLVIGWTAIACAGLAMLLWSWGTWPNAYVDFGRELYVPWRLAEGEVLYRDLAWFNGPLSAYRNALLFWLFGPGLMTLVLANLVDVLVLVAALYWLVARVSDRLAATVACLVFVVLFAFSRIDAIGNDNYLTPYSHEVTHGLILSLLALAAFAALRAAPARRALVVGLLLGLVALTKAEPMLAAVVALFCGTTIEALVRRRRGEPAGFSVGTVSLFVCALLLPGAAAFSLLALAMPVADALSGVLGAWPALFASDVSSEHFYRATLGLIGLGDNVVGMLIWAGAWACVFGLITVAALRAGARSHSPSDAKPGDAEGAFGATAMMSVGCFVLALVGVVLLGDAFAASWPEFTRPLPLVVAVLAVISGTAAIRGRPGVGDPVLRTTLLVFATVLLAKIVFRVRLDQYGFALAMPATMLVTAAVVCWLPRWIDARAGDLQIARAASLGVVAAVVVALLPTIAFRIAERTHPVASGRDTFLAEDVVADPMRAALRFLEARPPAETLAVLPEGVMINYVLRRVNPSGHVNFMPPELAIFGESQILAALAANPPNWIALTHKDTREYGVGFFGRGYGRNLHTWVRESYEPVALFGDPPGRLESRFGIELLRLRD